MAENKKVMVAIDESEQSHYALIWVLENLKKTIEKTPLVIFMAQSTPNHNITFAASLGSARMYCAVASSPIVDSLKVNQARLANALLEKAKAICASRGVIAETITEMGDPKTAICKAIQQHNVNMLILGEGGDGIIKRALMGSVSNYCVQNAKCPVLVVKKP